MCVRWGGWEGVAALNSGSESGRPDTVKRRLVAPSAGSQNVGELMGFANNPNNHLQMAISEEPRATPSDHTAPVLCVAGRGPDARAPIGSPRVAGSTCPPIKPAENNRLSGCTLMIDNLP